MKIKKTPVIFDCDPGQDDAIALVLAFACAELDIKAVTVCAGNVEVEKTLINAKKILRFLGQKTPLARGAAKPMFRELTTAPQIHGANGLNGPNLPEPDYPEEPVQAVELMRRIIMESPEPITLIATGPLTNLGILLTAFPEVKKNIAKISFMGGGVNGGNWTAAAEFNFFVDPEAADLVLGSGLPLIMSGLNVTQKALIMKEEIESIRALGAPVQVFTAEILTSYLGSYLKRGYPGAALHDPCAVACITNPELFSAKPLNVKVETQGKYTSGMSLADLRLCPESEANVSVNMEVDREGLIKLLSEAAGSY